MMAAGAASLQDVIVALENTAEFRGGLDLMAFHLAAHIVFMHAASFIALAVAPFEAKTLGCLLLAGIGRGHEAWDARANGKVAAGVAHQGAGNNIAQAIGLGGFQAEWRLGAGIDQERQ
jgi:hypothetical protein